MSEKWHAWKKDPTPETLGALYHEVDRTIKHAVDQFSASGIPTPALESQARTIAYKAFKSFDPSKAQLHTHVHNHLKNLNRYVDKYSQTIRLPETKARQADKVYKAMKTLEERLGRMPTTTEISEHTGIGQSTLGGLMRHQTHLYSNNEGSTFGQPVMDNASDLELAQEVVFHMLNPQQQIVFQHTLGYAGHPRIAGGDIAKMLKVSPARVTAVRKDIGKRMEEVLQANSVFTS